MPLVLALVFAPSPPPAPALALGIALVLGPALAHVLDIGRALSLTLACARPRDMIQCLCLIHYPRALLLLLVSLSTPECSLRQLIPPLMGIVLGLRGGRLPSVGRLIGGVGLATFPDMRALRRHHPRSDETAD